MRVFFRLRKTYMTLLETLIAISLLSMMLVFVFGFFRELSELTRLSEKTQKESFQTRYLESRLGFIFERIVNDNENKTKNNSKKNSIRRFFFYTEPPGREISNSPSLILTFNNGVRLAPIFSGEVLGRLYVDLDHHLCLSIWPLYVEEPHQYMHEEILCHDVANVNYEFYAAPERMTNEQAINSGEQVDPEKRTPEKDKWHKDEWLISYDQMPSILKMTIQVAKNPEELKKSQMGAKIETNDLAFYFVLPSSENYIYYPPD